MAASTQQSKSKLRVLIPGAVDMYLGYPALEHIIHSQVDPLSVEDLRADPSLGVNVKVGFYCGPSGLNIFECKEQGLLPNLGLVCNHGVGVNHMPFDRLRALDLQLTNTPGVLSDSTADMALGLMLASGRQFSIGMDWAMRKPGADKPKLFAELKLGQEINHAALGIVGMGSIGYKIAERAKAFKMPILYHNRTQRSREEEEAVGATYYPELLTMLPLCDFVVIACPLTPETTKLFRSREFKAMKNSAHLINIARGGIVDTDSLVEALSSKEIQAAGLDVTDPEPLPDNHPLLSFDNVIILPHWGTATVRTRGIMQQLMIDNAKAFVEGKPLLSEVKF